MNSKLSETMGDLAPALPSIKVDESSNRTDTTQSANQTDHLKKTLFCHRTSLESLTEWHWQESRVLVLYTGGTIGMSVNARGKLVPTGAMESYLRKYSHMNDEEYCKKRFSSLSHPPLVLPDCREKRRVVYWVHEYSPLLDSSNMTMNDWIQIGKDIETTYEDFDGFVILHGTDTLAYTAAALSFMLQDLGKPVVITGSQIPLFEPRSDGRDNFIGSLIMAGSYSNIPEVTVFFNNKLFRGNRTAKVSTGSLNAFDSPNFPPLATAGISISVDYRNIFRPSSLAKFSVFSKLNSDVGLLRIFPSISTESVRSFLAPLKGAVIQTYGSGNIPSNRLDVINVMKEASERGVLIINITQCMHGGVEAIYETGEALETAGVLMGLDMTPEAALAKLSYVLAKDVDHETKKKMMNTNLRGEMTVMPVSGDEAGGEDDPAVDDIIASISRALEMASAECQHHLQELLVPTLFLTAVQNADISRMDQLSQHVLDMNQKDAMGSTCLHVAASQGCSEVVKWLLLHGALVHARDVKGHTPLWVAVCCDHGKIIDLLVQTGAHLMEMPSKVGESMVSAAATNNKKRISSFIRAGADVDQTDALGRTALHAACVVGATSSVKLLLGHGANPKRKDRTGLTAIECAEVNGHNDIVKLCTSNNS